MITRKLNPLLCAFAALALYMVSAPATSTGLLPTTHSDSSEIAEVRLAQLVQQSNPLPESSRASPRTEKAESSEDQATSREPLKIPNRRPTPGTPVVEDAVNPSLEASWRHPWRHRPPPLGIPGISQRFLEAPSSADKPGTEDKDSIIFATPQNYTKLTQELQPGDHLRLKQGIYRKGLELRGLKGEPARPIIISGPQGPAEQAILIGRKGQNTVSLGDSAHIILRDLQLDGRGMPVSGVVAEAGSGYTHDITLERIHIHSYAAGQGNNAITTRSAAWRWTIRDSVIHDVGTGLYLGQPDGGAPFIAGLIEGNKISRTLGYNMQIKHQHERQNLSGMPTTPQQTIIRYNTFDKSARGNSGARARPNLLVGHWPPQGPGKNDRYLIYANHFYANPHERLFQGEGNIALYNNTFINRHEAGELGGDGIIIRPHNGVPKELYVLNNTVLTSGFGIKIVAPQTGHPQIVSGNTIFSSQPLLLEGISAQGNFTADPKRLLNPESLTTTPASAARPTAPEPQ